MAKAKIQGGPGFDFVDEHRGQWARLRNGRWEVVLVEWPASFLSMLRAGVLVGRAQDDALELARDLER